MPWTLGDSFVSVFDLDILVPVDEPLIETAYAGFIDDVQTGACATKPGDRHPGHRREHRLARGGRIDARGGHRTYPPRGGAVPQGQEGPRHPHRGDHRRDHRSGRRGRHHRHPEVRRPRQDRHHLRHGHQEAVRLRGQQPALLLQPHRVRQRSVRHRAAEQDGGHQHRARGRSHRAGVRRLAGLQVLLRHRRTGRLQPGRRPLAGRPRHHRAALHRRGRQGVAHRGDAQAGRRAWSPPEAPSTTW